MKKILFLLASMILVLINAIPVIAEQSTKVYFDIDFEKNIVFDKYNVELYLDEEKVGTLEHGEVFTKLVEVQDSGKHLLTFYKEDDHSINELKAIDVTENITFSCKIVSHSDEIDVNDIQTNAGIEGAFLQMIDMTHVGLADAYKQLEDVGYININSKDQKGSNISSSNRYIVLSQNITPGKKIDKNEEIILSCQKVSEYIDSNFLNLKLEDAKKVAEQLGYGITFYQKITGNEMDSKIADLPENEKEEWTATDANLDKNVVKLGMIYSGKRECPNIVGISLAEAQKVLQENDFSESDYEVVTDDWVWNENNWEVLYQNINPGEIVDVNTKIEMKVQSYDSIEENGILLEESPLYNQTNKKENETETSNTEVASGTEKSNKEMSSTETDQEKIPMPMSNLDCEGLNYLEVKRIFLKAGYKNIRTIPREMNQEDTICEDGSVVTVFTKEQTNFDKDEMFDADTEIVIGYRKIVQQNTEVLNETDTHTESQNITYQVEDIKKTMFASTNVNVRSGPGTEYEKVGQLSSGEEVNVTGLCKNDWYRILYNDQDGYVSGNYLSERSSTTEKQSQIKTTEDQPSQTSATEDQGPMVWIPTNGGTKYHSKSSCSNMENPIQVPLKTAQQQGYEACKRCH